MSDYIIASPFVAAGPASITHATPQAPLGFEVDAFDRAGATSLGAVAGRFVYARGSNVASAGQFVHLQNGSAVLLAAANSVSAFPVGVAAGVLSATNVYGWVQVQGRCDYARGTNSAPTANVQVYICAGTPGYVLTNVVAGNRVQGVVGVPGQTNTAVSSAGSYQYDLNRPFCAGLTASL